MGKFNYDISKYTGERVVLVKVKCKCGHVISFISNNSIICNHCGRRVYASERQEFKDKLMKEINKCQ